MSGDLSSGRWLASLGLAALGHGAVLVAGLSWAASPPMPSGAPVFAVEIAAAPPAPAPMPEARPETPPPPPEVKPEPPKPATAEVPLPRPKPPAPKPKPQAKPAAEATPEPRPALAAPPAPAPEPEDKAAAAPAPGANPRAMARAASWQGEVLGRLEQYKRYPRSAQWKRREGAAVVAFTIDRDGRLLAKRLNRSSGHDDLDAEALALLDRAQPLPPPPENVPGERIELVVPIQFYLKR